MRGMHWWIGLSDEVRLGVLTEWVSADLVDEVLAECGRRDKRPGALPARFMVCYVLALALFQQDSYDNVAENLVGALEGMDEAIPNKSSFTRARQRLGAGVIEAVFRRLAGPVAPAGLDGAFWRGMRVAAVDGFVLDVPDTPVNRAAFGGPADARGRRPDRRPPRPAGERPAGRRRLAHHLGATQPGRRIRMAGSRDLGSPAHAHVLWAAHRRHVRQYRPVNMSAAHAATAGPAAAM
jgi:Insertion element 4 transposase N-terminal